jgi:hypothetical protein
MVIQAFNGVILTYFEVNSLNRKIPFSRIKFLTDNMIKPWSIVLLSSVIPALGIYFLDESVIRLLITFMVSLVICPLIIYLIGLDNNQKLTIQKIILSKLLRRAK